MSWHLKHYFSLLRIPRKEVGELIESSNNVSVAQTFGDHEVEEMRFSMLTRSGFRRTSYSCCSSTSVVGGIQRWICKSLVFNAHATEHEVMPRMSHFFQKLKAEAVPIAYSKKKQSKVV
jgi:hypothetical protein